jgi:hypothetical protein
MSDACSAHGKVRNTYTNLVESLEGRDHSEDLSVSGRIILKWILGKSRLRVWIRVIWFRIGNDCGVL